MPYRTILINLNDEERATTLIQTALSLRGDCEVHIIGLYVMPWAIPPAEFAGPPALAWLEDQLACYREQGHRIKVAFEAIIKGAKNVTHEWRHDDSSFDANVADAIVDHARTVDLVVVSQAGHNAWIDDIPERVAIEGGRPVFVVPREGDFNRIGKEVTIAWKPTREATRAVFDALPVLKNAQHVRLLTVTEKDISQAEERGRISGEELASSLLRHGIQVETETLAQDDLSVANRLLERSRRTYQDLIVMGIYGHSRLREFVLGGVSREILHHASVPVLIAH